MVAHTSVDQIQPKIKENVNMQLNYNAFEVKDTARVEG